MAALLLSILHSLFLPSLSVTSYHLAPNLHSDQQQAVPPSVTIGQDPRGKLPPKFTICASFYFGLRTRVTQRKAKLVLDIRGPKAPKEELEESKAHYLKITMLLEYSTMKNTGFVVTASATKALYRFGQVNIEKWNHICASVDAISGFLSIVINGEVAFNEINKFLINSVSTMPPSAVDSVWFYGEFIDLASFQTHIFQRETSSPTSTFTRGS